MQQFNKLAFDKFLSLKSFRDNKLLIMVYSMYGVAYTESSEFTWTRLFDNLINISYQL